MKRKKVIIETDSIKLTATNVAMVDSYGHITRFKQYKVASLWRFEYEINADKKHLKALSDSNENEWDIIVTVKDELIVRIADHRYADDDFCQLLMFADYMINWVSDIIREPK